MKSTKSNLSSTWINRIKVQGYQNYSDQQIAELAFGNRFAYQLCTACLFVGVLLCNIPILGTMMGIAFLGVVLSNHPFDYIYNYFLVTRMNKPQLPARSKQLKFACLNATFMIGATIYFAQNNMMTIASILGYTLVGVAFLVATTDFCIPSVIYNVTIGKLFKD
ncbi:MAG: DUF4395 family protein [Saprospiraceae bacterium]